MPMTTARPCSAGGVPYPRRWIVDPVRPLFDQQAQLVGQCHHPVAILALLQQSAEQWLAALMKPSAIRDVVPCDQAMPYPLHVPRHPAGDHKITAAYAFQPVEIRLQRGQYRWRVEPGDLAQHLDRALRPA